MRLDKFSDNLSHDLYATSSSVEETTGLIALFHVRYRIWSRMILGTSRESDTSVWLQSYYWFVCLFSIYDVKEWGCVAKTTRNAERSNTRATNTSPTFVLITIHKRPGPLHSWCCLWIRFIRPCLFLELCRGGHFS